MATSSLAAPGQVSARRTTVFLKILMALSGALFVLYVLAHMYGNLKILGGTRGFDEYALHLRTLLTPLLPVGGVLWILRALLVVALVAHAWAAFTLWARANGARTTRYVAKQAARASIKSRMMRWGGVALLLFVVWHLLQFTILRFNVNPSVPAARIGDSAGALVIASFQVWWNVALYLLALVALGMHLYHGVYSAAQTLGWTNTGTARAAAKATGQVVAVVTAVGFAIPPLAILFGLVKGS